MADREYTESGLVFRFREEYVFKPDELPAGSRYQNVKGCDFIWRNKNGRVEIIEAKSSVPRSSSDLELYLEDISIKFVHSILLWLSATFGRHRSVQVAQFLSEEGALKAKPRFLLIINGLTEKHAPDLQHKFQNKLMPIRRAFAMDPPLVLTEQKARELLLIL
jgi:hypothetical protein